MEIKNLKELDFEITIEEAGSFDIEQEIYDIQILDYSIDVTVYADGYNKKYDGSLYDPPFNEIIVDNCRVEIDTIWEDGEEVTDEVDSSFILEVSKFINEYVVIN